MLFRDLAGPFGVFPRMAVWLILSHPLPQQKRGRRRDREGDEEKWRV